jgi:superfamily I DNA and RNA helicase
MIEHLAAHAHNQWSGWMRYLFSKCELNDDGSATIPAESVKRWQRQMETDYIDLPEDEKESDRKEAREMIDAVNAALEEVHIDAAKETPEPSKRRVMCFGGCSRQIMAYDTDSHPTCGPCRRGE